MTFVKIIFLNVDVIKDNASDIVSYIGDELTKKAYRYKNENDVLLSLGSSYLKKKCIGEYSVSDYGKPVSENMFFSVSHSFEYVAIAFNSDYSVGLDLEKSDQHFESDVVSFCLSDYEIAHLKDFDFIDQFVSKESLAKAYGTGLTNEIKDIPSLPVCGYISYMGKKYYRKSKKINGYTISVSLENDDFETDEEILNKITF